MGVFRRSIQETEWTNIKNKTLYRLIPIKETDLKFFSQE